MIKYIYYIILMLFKINLIVKLVYINMYNIKNYKFLIKYYLKNKKIKK